MQDHDTAGSWACASSAGALHRGEPLATINRTNHVHLNIGWPGEEYNPLHFGLVQFADTVAPTIRRGGIRLFGEDGHAFAVREQGRVIVQGRVQVVVDAWDQVDGNKSRRRLGLYRLGYQVLTRAGAPAPGFEVPRETIRFDRFTGDADAARLIYASGSGIPFYGGRSSQFLYIVTNTLRDGVAASGTWDTTTMTPGDYASHPRRRHSRKRGTDESRRAVEDNTAMPNAECRMLKGPRTGCSWTRSGGVIYSAFGSGFGIRHSAFRESR